MFSCCCAAVDRTWRPICDCPTSAKTCSASCIIEHTNIGPSYYNLAQTIYVAIRSIYPSDIAIWLTGHSLGGALASLLGLTNGVPVFTFEAPGDLLYAERLGLLPDIPSLGLTGGHPHVDRRRPDYHDFFQTLPIYHFGNSGDPIFLGTCTGASSSCYWGGYAMESKCHVGKTCTYDVNGMSSNETLQGQDIRNHGLVRVLEIISSMDVPECITETNCQDCAAWQFE